MKTHPAIADEVLQKTQCDRDFACLEDPSICKTSVFFDRDVELLRCEEERKCKYRKYYLGHTLCDCPVSQEKLN